MQTKEIKDLAMALAKAQGEILPAHKGTINNFHNSSYADIASCWNACRTALSKNELSIVQYPGKSEPNYLNLISLLLHSSGQWIKGSIRMKLQTRKKGIGWVDADDPQTYGITMTYARRYGLCGMVGIAPGDSDGEPTDNGNGNGNDHTETNKILTEKEKKALSEEIPPKDQDDIPLDPVTPITRDNFVTSDQATAYRKECIRLKIATKAMKAELKEHGISMPDKIPADQYDVRFKELEFLANEAKNGVTK